MKNKFFTLAVCLIMVNFAAFAQSSPKNTKVHQPKKAQKASLNSQDTKKAEKK